MASLSNSLMQQKGENLPSKSPLCPYLDKMGPWIIAVLQDVMPSKLNTTIFGPRHCQVLQDGKINFTHDGFALKVITDGKTLIHALFTEDAVKSYKERCDSQDSDSQQDWECSVIMLEEFKVIHVSVSEKEYGELVFNVDKFVYLGEPVVRSEGYLDLPFPFRWPDDHPDIKLKCQEIWELRLLSSNSAQGSPSLLELEELLISPVHEGYVDSLCREKTADQFLLISSPEREILDGLEEWKEASAETRCEEMVTENNCIVTSNSVGGGNEPQPVNEALQKSPSTVNSNFTIQPQDSQSIIFIKEVTSKEKDSSETGKFSSGFTNNDYTEMTCAQKDRVWLHHLTRKCRIRQRKLSEWRSIFKRSLKSFSRLKRLSTGLAVDERINVQEMQESPDSLFTSSAPPDLSTDPWDYSTENKEKSDDSVFSNEAVACPNYSLAEENDRCEDQRLDSLKDVSELMVCNDETKLAQDESSNFTLHDLNMNTDHRNVENIEDNYNVCDMSLTLINSDNKHGNNCDKILGVSSLDDWSVPLSDSIQVQCSASFSEDKNAVFDDSKLVTDSIPDNQYTVSKNDTSSLPSELNPSNTYVDSKNRNESLAGESSNSTPLTRKRTKDLDLKPESCNKAIQVCIPSESNRLQKRNSLKASSARKSLKGSSVFPVEQSYDEKMTTMHRQYTSVSPSHSLSVQSQSSEGTLKRRRNGNVYEHRAKVPRSMCKHCCFSSRYSNSEVTMSSNNSDELNKMVNCEHRTNSSPLVSERDSEFESVGSEESYYSVERQHKIPNILSLNPTTDYVPETSSKRNTHFKSRRNETWINQQNSQLNCTIETDSSINIRKNAVSPMRRSEICSTLKNTPFQPVKKVIKDRLESSICSSVRLQKELPSKSPTQNVPLPNSKHIPSTNYGLHRSTSSRQSRRNQEESLDSEDFNIFARSRCEEPFLNFQFNPRLVKRMWQKIVHITQ